MSAIELFDPEFSFNPKFTYITQVHFDELDAMQMLHNSRFAAHVERAVIAFYHEKGRTWEQDPAGNPDQFHVVKDFRIEFLSPVSSLGPMRVDIWVERLGTTSCVYGFHCASQDGKIPYARGTRAIIKIDPTTKQPAPWTEYFREAHRELVKDLPAMP